MALALPTVKTYADMLQELRGRVKMHPTIGAAPALESILTEANDYIFDQLDDGLPWQSTLTLVPNVALYSFVTDEGLPVARGSVREVWVEQGDTIRTPLPQGISHAQRADQNLRDIPTLHDTTMTGGDFSLEVWPTPDQAYRLFIDHNRVLSRFSQPTDKPCAPYRLVLGYAIAMAKAHLGQADADVVGKSMRTLLTSEKQKQRENRRFLPPSGHTTGPRVVRATDGTYRQVNY